MNYYHNDFELGWIWGPFKNELVKLLPLIDKTKSNDSNRTYLRSLFSMIQGIAYRTRQILLERHKGNIINLEIEQIIGLSEISIEIKDNGTIKTRPKVYDFKNMLLFTYKIYCERYNKTDIYMRFLSDPRYSDFLESIKMRNRIAHPKSGKDVFINGDDIQKILSAGDWYEEFTFELFMGDLITEE